MNCIFQEEHKEELASTTSAAVALAANEAISAAPVTTAAAGDGGEEAALLKTHKMLQQEMKRLRDDAQAAGSKVTQAIIDRDMVRLEMSKMRAEGCNDQAIVNDRSSYDETLDNLRNTLANTRSDLTRAEAKLEAFGKKDRDTTKNHKAAIQEEGKTKAARENEVRHEMKRLRDDAQAATSNAEQAIQQAIVERDKLRSEILKMRAEGCNDQEIARQLSSCEEELCRLKNTLANTRSDLTCAETNAAEARLKVEEVTVALAASTAAANAAATVSVAADGGVCGKTALLEELRSQVEEEKRKVVKLALALSSAPSDVAATADAARDGGVEATLLKDHALKRLHDEAQAADSKAEQAIVKRDTLRSEMLTMWAEECNDQEIVRQRSTCEEELANLRNTLANTRSDLTQAEAKLEKERLKVAEVTVALASATAAAHFSAAAVGSVVGNPALLEQLRSQVEEEKRKVVELALALSSATADATATVAAEGAGVEAVLMKEHAMRRLHDEAQAADSKAQQAIAERDTLRSEMSKTRSEKYNDREIAIHLALCKEDVRALRSLLEQERSSGKTIVNALKKELQENQEQIRVRALASPWAVGDAERGVDTAKEIEVLRTNLDDQMRRANSSEAALATLVQTFKTSRNAAVAGANPLTLSKVTKADESSNVHLNKDPADINLSTPFKALERGGDWLSSSLAGFSSSFSEATKLSDVAVPKFDLISATFDLPSVPAFDMPVVPAMFGWSSRDEKTVQQAAKMVATHEGGSMKEVERLTNIIADLKAKSNRQQEDTNRLKDEVEEAQTGMMTARVKADGLRREADRLRHEVQQFQNSEVDQALMTLLGEYEDLISDLKVRVQDERHAAESARMMMHQEQAAKEKMSSELERRGRALTDRASFIAHDPTTKHEMLEKEIAEFKLCLEHEMTQTKELSSRLALELRVRANLEAGLERENDGSKHAIDIISGWVVTFRESQRNNDAKKTLRYKEEQKEERSGLEADLNHAQMLVVKSEEDSLSKLLDVFKKAVRTNQTVNNTGEELKGRRASSTGALLRGELNVSLSDSQAAAPEECGPPPVSVKNDNMLEDELDSGSDSDSDTCLSDVVLTSRRAAPPHVYLPLAQSGDVKSEKFESRATSPGKQFQIELMQCKLDEAENLSLSADRLKNEVLLMRDQGVDRVVVGNLATIEVELEEQRRSVHSKTTQELKAELERLRMALVQERKEFEVRKMEEERLFQLERFASRSNLDEEQKTLMAEKFRLEQLAQQLPATRTSESTTLSLERARADLLQKELEAIKKLLSKTELRSISSVEISSARSRRIRELEMSAARDSQAFLQGLKDAERREETIAALHKEVSNRHMVEAEENERLKHALNEVDQLRDRLRLMQGGSMGSLDIEGTLLVREMERKNQDLEKSVGLKMRELERRGKAVHNLQGQLASAKSQIADHEHEASALRSRLRMLEARLESTQQPATHVCATESQFERFVGRDIGFRNSMPDVQFLAMQSDDVVAFVLRADSDADSDEETAGVFVQMSARGDRSTALAPTSAHGEFSVPSTPVIGNLALGDMSRVQESAPDAPNSHVKLRNAFGEAPRKSGVGLADSPGVQTGFAKPSIHRSLPDEELVQVQQKLQHTASRNLSDCHFERKRVGEGQETEGAGIQHVVLSARSRGETSIVFTPRRAEEG